MFTIITNYYLPDITPITPFIIRLHFQQDLSPPPLLHLLRYESNVQLYMYIIILCTYTDRMIHVYYY